MVVRGRAAGNGRTETQTHCYRDTRITFPFRPRPASVLSASPNSSSVCTKQSEAEAFRCAPWNKAGPTWPDSASVPTALANDRCRSLSRLGWSRSAWRLSQLRRRGPGRHSDDSRAGRMSACSGSPALSKRMAFIFLVLSLDVWQRSAMFAWLATAKKRLHP